MPDEIKRSNELHETDLEAAAGGATVNRYNAEKCGYHKGNRAWKDCEAFFGLSPCDHFRKDKIDDNTYHFVCKMGIFDYQADWGNTNVRNRVI